MINTQKVIVDKYPKINSVPKPILNYLFGAVRKVIHENDINKFLEDNKNLGAFSFVDSILEYFNFSYKFNNKELENIPTSGKVVIVANHPLGALDAISLIDLIHSVRSDIKVVANDVLSSIEQLKPILIGVDSFGSSLTKESVKDIRNALNNNEAVIIFPSGEVSRARTNGIKDLKWNKGFLKFATDANAPILPIHIKAKNSAMFYTLSSINKSISTFLLPHEMFRQKGGSLEFTIGELIPYKNYAKTNIDVKTTVKLFKKHLYRISKGKKGIFETEKAIAHPEDRQKLKKELLKTKLLGTTSDNKKIYLYEYEQGSVILKEIARLRELTFRKVEEGTGARRDKDNYDYYYKHIVLWDDNDLEIVGAYRIGESNFIEPNLGVQGFYTNTLFNFKEEFKDYLFNSIELGRSFVQPKYWGSRALDYLWQGIGAYLYNNPNIKYMFGPVSLSSALPKEALNLITYYYNLYYGCQKELVESKRPFKLTTQKEEELSKIFSGDDIKQDFLTLRNQLSYYNATVPTLYKQYTELCENDGVKFLDFNIDKDFNDCIDGFILVDITKIKAKKAERYIKGL